LANIEGGYVSLSDGSTTTKHRVLQYDRKHVSVVRPRTEIDGNPNAENLGFNKWRWTLTDFVGGEGRIVFNSNEALQGTGPGYRKTSGGIDTRKRGSFQMSPIDNLVTASGGTTTRTEGSSLTLAGGASAVGSNARLNASGESATEAANTPGAVAVTVTARLVNITSTESATFRLRVRNTTDGTDTTSTTYSIIGPLGEGTATVVASFTGVAGKTYSYIAEYSAYSGSAGTTSVDVDYIDELSGAGLDDAYHVHHGPASQILAFDHDGANTDVYKWDFSNDDWDSLVSNLAATTVVGIAHTDTFTYVLGADRQVYAFDSAGSSGQYADEPTSFTEGSSRGIAVGNNRIYTLFTNGLFELTTDGSVSSSTAEGAAGYTLKAGAGEFGAERSVDQSLRQQICGTDNGVRWFCNVNGGPSQVWEFADDTLRPLCVFPAGLLIKSIYHYQGITWFGVQSEVSSAASPAAPQSFLYYFDPAVGMPRRAVRLRFEEPDDQPPRYISAWGDDLYILQGNKVWRYDGNSGGLVLDRVVSGSDDTKVRSFVVLDNKLWSAYEDQGVFVTQDTYPIDNTLYIESPIYDFDAPGVTKVFTGIKVRTAPLPANTTISVEYQIDESGSWTTAGTLSTDNETDHLVSLAGVGSSTKKGDTIQVRLGLASSDGADTPEVRSWTVEAIPVEYVTQLHLVLDSSNDGSGDHLPGSQLSGHQQRDLIQTWINNKQLLTLTDKYESANDAQSDTYTVVLHDPEANLTTRGQGKFKLVAEVV
jgi:hypothetical protein